MRRSCLSILILISIILLLSLPSFATFSITAVDTLTKEVGSAGASCVAGSIMLSDVHPNKGVIHTQAAYLSANQTKASGFMNAGYTPQQIVDSVVKYDAQGNPGPRQYGVVDLTNNGRTAGYSGAGCTDYTGDPSCIKNYIILGRNYPNPFTHSTRIEYMLLKPSRVEIKIFSTTGREIITLIKKNQQADRYVITWDGKDSYGKPVNGGVYMYKLQTNGLCLSRRMLLLR